MSDKISISDAELLGLRHGGPEHRVEFAILAKSDPEVAQRLSEWDRQDAALASLYNPVADEGVPARYQTLIATAARAPRGSIRSAARIAAAVVLLGLGGAGGWFAAQQTVQGQVAEGFAMEAMRAFSTYTVEIAHPVEVPASEQAHLVNWLSKRLGRHITPPDLSSNGFHLLGGRVVPNINGTAALMMYEDELGHRITLYVAPAPIGTETAFRFARNEQVQGFWWVDNQLGCALLGDIPRDMLRVISLSAYHQIDEA